VHGCLDLLLPERFHVPVGGRGVRTRDVDAVGVLVLHGSVLPEQLVVLQYYFRLAQ
jgi:hypothetical protein